jgi:hypothetical protein
MGYALREFLTAVRLKRLPETHVAEHIRSLAIVLAAIESFRRAGFVALEEFTGFLK